MHSQNKIAIFALNSKNQHDVANNDSERAANLQGSLCNDYLCEYDTTRQLSGIDLCVAVPQGAHAKAEREWLMWAVEKKSSSQDIHENLVQLILTIGKTQAYEKQMPPRFLTEINPERITFLPYEQIMEVFSENDFNWNVQASERSSKEYKHLKRLLDKKAKRHLQSFSFGKDDKALRKFIARAFKCNPDAAKIDITKSNYVHVFHKWLAVVKPTIDCVWDVAKGYGIHERDFFLADLFHRNSGARPRLHVRTEEDRYVVRRGASMLGGIDLTEIFFSDSIGDGKDGLAHRQFWSLYKRPPRKAYWDFILSHRDLLTMPDARAYKGAFFTPELWVRKSHEYLRDCLGDDWQQNYYIWDCTAGTGNMEAGLVNKQNVWASTIDQSDIDALHTRIALGMNLLDDHIFKFDFLNDPFNHLPDGLRQIIADDDKRKRLVIYFNPPSAEAGSSHGKAAKAGVSNQTRVHDDYAVGLGNYAKRELGAQFLMRIYKELPDCTIGIFAKLKFLQSPYFRQFRNSFKAVLKKMFIVPADTFDNVKGSFPYGFMVFDTKEKEVFRQCVADTYDHDGQSLGGKTILSYDGMRLLNDWLRPTWSKKGLVIGCLVCNSNDFGHQNEIVIQSKPSNSTSTFFKPITPDNLIMSSIYLAVRKCIAATWTNDRDQYLFPNDGWRDDHEFQGDCLTYALFDNVVQAKYGTNYWIPYSESQVGAKGSFKSHFMLDFINGRLSEDELAIGKEKTFAAFEQNLGGDFANSNSNGDNGRQPMRFSKKANDVFAAGLALWRYYHAQPNARADAAFYDIRLYFQGYRTTKSGKIQMNATSGDEEYTRLITTLRQSLKILAKGIEPKAYEYGFIIK